MQFNTVPECVDASIRTIRSARPFELETTGSKAGDKKETFSQAELWMLGPWSTVG